MHSAFVLSRLAEIQNPHALDRACVYMELRSRNVAARLAFRTAAAFVRTNRKAASQTAPAVRVCEYCEAAPATGYVRAYDAHVCRACYADHHGGPADMLDAGEEVQQ